MARGVGAWVQVAVTCVEGPALVATGWAASEWAAKGPAKECRLSHYCEERHAVATARRHS
jgi:hypothetical protein